MFKSAAVAACLLALSGAALADPVGSYTVIGTNPDDGTEYRGSVDVRRTGQTYEVVWDISGAKFFGVGIGALVRDGRNVVGAADSEHTSLLVGYSSAGDYGPAFYVEQADGSWLGVWSYSGSAKISTENWFPR